MSNETVQRTICDLCKQPINTDEPWPRLLFPFNADERERMAQALAARFPLPVGNMLGITRNIPPIKYHWFDFCAGCLEGFLPMLDEFRRLAYTDQLADIEGRLKKTAARGAYDGPEP